MTWTLFLDDEREPTPDLGDVHVARDSAEAEELIRAFGCPAVISFDHDLGAENGVLKPNALSFLRWIIDQHLCGDLDLHGVKRIIVHSRNQVGAKNIAGLWDNFATSVLTDSAVQAELRPRATLKD